MKTYISLLRGINVSGQKKIKMAELKALYEDLGFAEVQTYIQSGNVIFKDLEEDADILKNKIETKILEMLGYQVVVFILSPESLQKTIAENPFMENPEVDTSKIYVTWLSEVPDPALIPNLEAIKLDTETFILRDDVMYFTYQDGYGKSKLDNNAIERKLKVRATTRNWRTTQQLYAMSLDKE